MFTLKISTANDAFDNESQEIARILRKIAGDLEKVRGRTLTKDGDVIRDINGNTVGKWELK